MNPQKETSRLGAAPPPADKRGAAVDWSEVHRRLEVAQAAVEGVIAPTIEQKRRVLRERAKRLARDPRKQISTDQHLEVVEFLLAHERYAIESSFVREVYPLKELTPLPCTPPFLLGIINLRGQILSVIDVKKFFELPEKGLTDLNKVIIVHKGAVELGILADAIVGVRMIPVQEVQPSLPTLTGIRAEYVKGVTKERLVILDVEKILRDKKITFPVEAERTGSGTASPE